MADATLRFTADDVTIHRIVEQEGGLLGLRTMLPGLSEAMLEANRDWLYPHSLDGDGRAVLAIQSYVVRTPHHTVLVDTCVGNHKSRPMVAAWNNSTSNSYEAALAAAGLGFDDIDYVMCTHLHVDHVGWNTRLVDGHWVPSFPRARYIAARGEYEHWQAQAAEGQNPMLEHFRDSVLPVMQAGRLDLVAEDFAIGDHVRLLPTPGHTPHHVAIGFGRGRDHAVMSGDLLHSPLQQRYPELSSVFDADPVQAAQSRRAFLERYCDTDTLCCFAHCRMPSVGRIRRAGEGFVCEPASGS